MSTAMIIVGFFCFILGVLGGAWLWKRELEKRVYEYRVENGIYVEPKKPNKFLEIINNRKKKKPKRRKKKK